MKKIFPDKLRGGGKRGLKTRPKISEENPFQEFLKKTLLMSFIVDFYEIMKEFGLAHFQISDQWNTRCSTITWNISRYLPYNAFFRFLEWLNDLKISHLAVLGKILIHFHHFWAQIHDFRLISGKIFVQYIKILFLELFYQFFQNWVKISANQLKNVINS